MRRIWLDIDLGELPGERVELYAAAHIANIACGGHAGDDASIDLALTACALHGTRIGAHPSYPDREGFGRRAMSLSPDALRVTVAEQCDRLVDRALRFSQRVDFVKAHGALYHAAHRDAAIAHAFVAGAVEALGYEIAMLGPRGGALALAAESAGVALLIEGFADRGTRDDGSLLPRDAPGAVISDPRVAAERASALIARGGIDAICVHGDSPSAVEIARAVRAVIDQHAAQSGT